MKYNFDAELADIVPMLPGGLLDDPVAARANIINMLSTFNAEVDTSALDIHEQDISGRRGEPAVRVRIYSPKNKSGTTAALLFIHGGGFVVGNMDTEHSASVAIARELGVVVVSVDYRLAPEAPFPAGLNDCYAALSWMHDSLETLDIDGDRIGIYGQSAGGGLAAALALMARDNNGPSICFQYLGMPELDDRLETVSMKTFVDTPMWHRPNAELSWQYYLGDSYQSGADNVPVYAAPARVSDASGLPPAYVTAMEFDPLRDEGVLYALKLMQAGVSVELHTFPGTFHGSSMMAHARVSQRQQEEMLEVLQKGLKVAAVNEGQA